MHRQFYAADTRREPGSRPEFLPGKADHLFPRRPALIRPVQRPQRALRLDARRRPRATRPVDRASCKRLEPARLAWGMNQALLLADQRHEPHGAEILFPISRLVEPCDLLQGLLVV